MKSQMLSVKAIALYLVLAASSVSWAGLGGLIPSLPNGDDAWLCSTDLKFLKTMETPGWGVTRMPVYLNNCHPDNGVKFTDVDSIDNADWVAICSRYHAYHTPPSNWVNRGRTDSNLCPYVFNDTNAYLWERVYRKRTSPSVVAFKDPTRNGHRLGSPYESLLIPTAEKFCQENGYSDVSNYSRIQVISA